MKKRMLDVALLEMHIKANRKRMEKSKNDPRLQNREKDLLNLLKEVKSR